MQDSREHSLGCSDDRAHSCDGATAGRPRGRKPAARLHPWQLGLLSAFIGVAVMGGCGTNAADLFLNQATATGRTFLDLWLTGFANGIADFLDLLRFPPPTDGDGNGNGNGADGATLFANNCAACHGPDGTGDIGPNILNTTADQLSTKFGGTHTGGSFPNLTQADLEAIAGFLSGDGGGDGDGGGGNGDTSEGAMLYAENCAVCHGADGSGGTAPGIQDFTAPQLIVKLDGTHGGGSFPDLTDENLLAISEFLATEPADGGNGGSGGLTGDPAAGAVTYANSCAVCHGADGTGGSALGITGLTAAEITQKLDVGPHAGGSFPALTEQDHADIAAFLSP